jgi:membrane protease YdiL (CAAX protease family)
LRALHGGLLLALLLIPQFVPALARWPGYLLVPLAGYAVVVCLVPPLRRTTDWLRPGRLDGRVLAAGAAIVLLSSAALLAFDALARPDVRPLAGQLPLGLPLPVAVTGALFAVVNALLEEVIFRGVLLDALASQVGMTAAVLVQAFAFGAGHAYGYPPGVLGMALAAVYGLLLGLLRLQAGGLAAPCLAHILADATIFWVVVTAGR